MSNLNHLTDETFESEVLQSDTPVLVDFYADWCGPCKFIAPMIEELADEAAGQYVVAKLNIDDNPQAPARYDVRSIPTLILFKAGEEAERIVGSVPKEVVLQRIRPHLSGQICATCH